jgi:thioredoxin:protein disulfide reductase
MKVRVMWLLVMICCLGSSGLAQTSGKVVKVKPGQDVYRVKRGGSVQATVVIDIDHGYHINSNRPLDKFLIATALKFEPVTGLAATRVTYPKAKMQKFSFSEKPMSVYEGKAVLMFATRALPTAAVGTVKLLGKLTVQACNNELCLRPQTVSVEIPVEVTN